MRYHYIYVYGFACMYVCMRVCVYCIYVCMYVYICMYACMNKYETLQLALLRCSHHNVLEIGTTTDIQQLNYNGDLERSPIHLVQSPHGNVGQHRGLSPVEIQTNVLVVISGHYPQLLFEGHRQKASENVVLFVHLSTQDMVGTSLKNIQWHQLLILKYIGSIIEHKI